MQLLIGENGNNNYIEVNEFLSTENESVTLMDLIEQIASQHGILSKNILNANRIVKII
jgi:hypothetical protein